MGSNVGLLTETQTQTSKHPDPYNDPLPKGELWPEEDPSECRQVACLALSDADIFQISRFKSLVCEVSLTETPQRPADMRAAASCCTLVHNFLPTQQAGR